MYSTTTSAPFSRQAARTGGLDCSKEEATWKSRNDHYSQNHTGQVPAVEDCYSHKKTEPIDDLDPHAGPEVLSKGKSRSQAQKLAAKQIALWARQACFWCSVPHYVCPLQLSQNRQKEYIYIYR